MQVEKDKIRTLVKEFRKSLSAEQKSQKDLSIYERIVNLDKYKRAKKVLLYCSKDIEVDTKAIIKNALDCDKQVYLPRCIGQDMVFYKINSFDDLRQGSFGLLEPKIECEKYLDSNCDDFCIIPALAVDEHKYRLGYGKGYYDRFLVGFKGYKCVLCYSENVVNKLPVFATDVKADKVIVD